MSVEKLTNAGGQSQHINGSTGFESAKSLRLSSPLTLGLLLYLLLSVIFSISRFIF